MVTASRGRAAGASATRGFPCARITGFRGAGPGSVLPWLPAPSAPPTRRRRLAAYDRRSEPDAARARKEDHSGGADRRSQGLAAGHEAARRRPVSRSTPSPAASQHPRWLYTLPNGDVLVAETNAPPRPEDGKGIKGAVMKKMMAKAGAAVPSANRITLLRDADGDGVAEIESPHSSTGLNSPFGMALIGNDLYVANTDAIVKFPYTRRAPPASRRRAASSPTCRAAISIITGPRTSSPARDGTKLYATVGSNSNVAENGMEAEEGRAAIWEVDVATGEKRLFATGIRNPNGMAWEPETRRAVDGRQRTRRARRRPRARLPDLGEGRRLLWLALQLLRPARR